MMFIAALGILNSLPAIHEPLTDLVRRPGAGIEKTLHGSAPTVAQEVSLLRGFDALCHNFKVQGVGNLDQRFHHGAARFIMRQIPQENLIELHLADRQFPQAI
jgi:hypothetical protein